MKKFLSTILAVCMIASVSSCGSTDDATETTTAAEGAVADDATAEDGAEDVADDVETTSVNTPEMDAFIEKINAEVPIYAEYLKESAQVPVRTGFAYSADLYGTGTESAITLEVYMDSLDKIAMKTVTDGVSSDIIMNNGTYYIVSAAEKQALYMELPEESKAEMASQMSSSLVPAFDADTATYATGTEEYNGTEYLFERITTTEMGDIVIYADKDTKEIKYLGSDGIIMEVTFFDHNVDSSVYEIPSDYTLTDMSAMMGGAAE